MANDAARRRNVRIAILSSVHMASDVRIFHKQARTLAAAGFDVYLVAAHDGPLLMDDVNVIPLARPKSRFWRMILTPFRVLRIAQRLRPDICHLHDPELIPVGLILKVMGKRVVYDAHEDLPKDILSKGWIAKPLRRVVAGIAKLVLALATRAFDAVVTATPSIAAEFPPGRATVIANYPSGTELTTDGFTPYPTREPQVIYVGGLSDIRGAVEMVRAIGMVPAAIGAELVIVGSIEERIADTMRSTPGWERTRPVGWVDRSQLGSYRGGARVGLIVFHPEPNHVDAQPNKLFEYMAAGLPVVASDFELWREIVIGEGCGLVVDPMSPSAIADAIEYLLTHPEEAETMGRRGRAAVLERYHWEVQGEKLVSLYDALAE